MIVIITLTLFFWALTLHSFQLNLKRRFLTAMMSLSVVDLVFLNKMQSLKITL